MGFKTVIRPIYTILCLIRLIPRGVDRMLSNGMKVGDHFVRLRKAGNLQRGDVHVSTLAANARGISDGQAQGLATRLLQSS